MEIKGEMKMETYEFKQARAVWIKTEENKAVYNQFAGFYTELNVKKQSVLRSRSRRVLITDSISMAAFVPTVRLGLQKVIAGWTRS